MTCLSFFYYYERPTISFIKWRRAAKAQLSHLFLLYFIISIEIYFRLIYIYTCIHQTHISIWYIFVLFDFRYLSFYPAGLFGYRLVFLLFGCLSAERTHTHKSQLTLGTNLIGNGLIVSNQQQGHWLTATFSSISVIHSRHVWSFSLSLHSPSSSAAQLSGCFYRDEWARIHVPFTFCWVCVCVETLLDTTTGGIERERRERFCFSFFFRLPWYGVNQFRFEMDYNLTLNWFDNERTHTHTCLGDAMITRSHSFGMCMMHVHFSLSHW